MTKPIPAIQKYMSTSPFAVERDQTLAAAHRLMREQQVRHLPVLSGSTLAGILTERDLRLIETFPGVDPEKVPVEDAMSTSVYAVSPQAPLDEVVLEMAEHKYGSAVVMQHGKVVGIFTTTDACRALGELLHTRLAR